MSEVDAESVMSSIDALISRRGWQVDEVAKKVVAKRGDYDLVQMLRDDLEALRYQRGRIRELEGGR